MATSLEILSDIAPEFEVLDSALRSRFLSRAAGELSPTALRSNYQMAAIYLAAHNLSRAYPLGVAVGSGSGGGSGGPVRREKAGDLEVEYAVSSTSYSGGFSGSSELMTTRFGQAYLRLIHSSGLSPLVVEPGW